MRLIAVPRCGFGNRVRFMATVYIMAKYLGFEFKVLWVLEDVCTLEFKDIFENDFEIKQIDNNNLKLSMIDNKFEEILINSRNKFNDIYIESMVEFKLSSMDVTTYLKEKHLFYNSLRFCKFYYQEIDKFGYNFDNIIGVHIRRYVDRYDKNDYTEDNYNNMSLDFNDYLSVLKKYPEKSLFFLVSNNPKDYERIKDKSNFVYIDTKDYLDKLGDKESMKLYVLNFICLTKCKEIIGTYWSSFSDEAIHCNRIKKQMVGKMFSRRYHCYGLNGDVLYS
jgi:hypothetical protein